MELDRDTIVFMLFLGMWVHDDEDFEDLAEGPYLDELKRKWREECLPCLGQNHSGDCTKMPAPCMRCRMDQIMATADRIKDA